MRIATSVDFLVGLTGVATFTVTGTCDKKYNKMPRHVGMIIIAFESLVLYGLPIISHTIIIGLQELALNMLFIAICMKFDFFFINYFV